MADLSRYMGSVGLGPAAEAVFKDPTGILPDSGCQWLVV